MLIDASYFNGEINIPNITEEISGNSPVLDRLNWFINKYEPEFLQKLFGYSFYKAFLGGITVTPPATPDSRWTDLIYGKEYTSISTTKLEKWKGLLITEIPVYSFGSGFFYKAPYWIQADVSPADFVSGVNIAMFEDWIGWTPIIDRVGGNGIMQEGVDYSFDSDADSLTAGQLILLQTGDQFQPRERFYISFQLKPQNKTDIDNSAKQSLIANYVYYWYQRNAQTQTTGIGETKTQPAGAVIDSAGDKATRSWNEMCEWIDELYEFMQSNTGIYTEYDAIFFSNAMCTSFKKINPFF